jgi:pyrrolidone-carboxylate peptidase
MTTVLITGFGRFPGAPFNPSGRAIANELRV